MHKRDISVVITDLDNTLYDWVEMWYQAFSAMLTKILEEAEPKGIARDRLISEIRMVHQRHGTSEYAFLLEDLPCLREAFPATNIIEHFNDAIHSYRKPEKNTSHFTPAFSRRFKPLKTRGCWSSPTPNQWPFTPTIVCAISN